MSYSNSANATQYQITNYTKNRAKQLGVSVKPSTRKGKKIDVYKNNKKVASVGALGYLDYPTYMKTQGMEVAKKRRKLYQKRHQGEQHVRDSPGFYAWYLLW